MRPLLRILGLALVVLLFPKIILSQQDPKAISIAAQSLVAMGSAALSTSQVDSRATGILTTYFDTPIQTNITLESKGLTQTRAELQQAAGTSVRVVNGGRGAIQNPDGSIRNLTQVNLFAEHVSHIPTLSLLAEIRNTAAKVELVSTAAGNGTRDHVIAVGLALATDSQQVRVQQAVSRTLFYINSTSGLVDKVEYTTYSEAPVVGISMHVQEIFSDFRNLNGIVVPFHKTTYLDGRLESDLQLNSVSFNVGVPDSHFVVPGAQQ